MIKQSIWQEGKPIGEVNILNFGEIVKPDRGARWGRGRGGELLLSSITLSHPLRISSIEYRVSNIEYQVSNIKYRVLNPVLCSLEMSG